MVPSLLFALALTLLPFFSTFVSGQSIRFDRPLVQCGRAIADWSAISADIYTVGAMRTRISDPTDSTTFFLLRGSATRAEVIVCASPEYNLAIRVRLDNGNEARSENYTIASSSDIGCLGSSGPLQLVDASQTNAPQTTPQSPPAAESSPDPSTQTTNQPTSPSTGPSSQSSSAPTSTQSSQTPSNASTTLLSTASPSSTSQLPTESQPFASTSTTTVTAQTLGIAIGVSGFVAVLFLVLVVWWRKRLRRAVPESARSTDPFRLADADASELDAARISRLFPGPGFTSQKPSVQESSSSPPAVTIPEKEAGSTPQMSFTPWPSSPPQLSSSTPPISSGSSVSDHSTSAPLASPRNSDGYSLPNPRRLTLPPPYSA